MKTEMVIIKGALGVAVFFALWFCLSQLNWMEIFKIDEVAETTEEKIGNAVWEMQTQQNREVFDSVIVKPIDSLLTQICKSNGIDRDNIKLHVLQKDDINAFSLPDGHLVIFSGLIDYCENQDELAGVMGHELAHIELSHVMKNLIKEIGLAAVLSTVAGDTGGAGLGRIFKTLTSSAYDRTLESEADRQAVDYLQNAEMDPQQLAYFMYRLSETEGSLNQNFEWVSSHPLTIDRAKDIAKLTERIEVKTNPVLSSETWVRLKQKIQELDYSDSL